MQWLDWSQQYPQQAPLVTVSSVEGVQQVVTSSTGVRPIGAGHSFSPLVDGAKTVLSLDGFKGIEWVDTEHHRVRVRAGSRLHELTALLHQQGLAFRNLGDIDRQSVAGATATATHGTGKNLPCLSAEIRALQVVRADGDVVDINGESDPDLLAAARVSLGVLGVITAVELQLVEAHRLHRRTWSEPLGDILEAVEHLWDTHRNFEFFYIPFSGYGLCITHDITSESTRHGTKGDDDKAVRELRTARTALRRAPKLRRRLIQRAMSRFPSEDAVDYNWRLLASSRNELFREMEYHLPPEYAMSVLTEVIDRIERDRPDVFFPIEVRQTASDDGWLSPFSDGNRISIAVHSWYRDDHQFMFDLLEPLFLAAGGRPHWGKMHHVTGNTLEQMYPRFRDFAELREVWDPTGKFLNAHTSDLFVGTHAR